jgi:polyphenol oxidase
VAFLTLPEMDVLPGIGHCYTTSMGGVSAAPYGGLNLALHVGDDPTAVMANRAALAAAIGLAPQRFVFANQVHGATVAVVTPDMADRGTRSDADAIPATDALVTAVPGLCLLVLVADCVPVLLADPRRRCVGAAHAGWRGTVQDIAGATVRVLTDVLGSDPADIIAAIGPSIGPADYEVGPEVVAAVQTALPTVWPDLLAPTRPGHARLDLWSANRHQLLAAGLDPAHVHVAGVSTARAGADFYSVRRQGSPTGRCAGGVWLAEVTADAGASALRRQTVPPA